jgi:hypothetical protein
MGAPAERRRFERLVLLTCAEAMLFLIHHGHRRDLTPDADSGRAFALVRASKGAKIMNDIMRIMQAADQAARWHRSQKRKGEAAEPYVNHLLEVASLVAQASDGDATCIIAALMHDAVED